MRDVDDYCRGSLGFGRFHLQWPMNTQLATVVRVTLSAVRGAVHASQVKSARWMLGELSCDVAARHLVAARIARRAGSELPSSCRPTDRDSALAIQRRVGELL